MRKAVPGKQNHGLYVYRGKKRDTYFVRREAEGKEPLWEKLKSRNLNDARQEMHERVREWLGEKPRFKEVQLLGELIPVWTKTKDDKSPATKESIANSMMHLEEFIGDLLPSQFTTGGWELYIQFKRNEDLLKQYYKSLGHKLNTKDQIAEFKKFRNQYLQKDYQGYLVFIEGHDPIFDTFKLYKQSKRKFFNDWRWLNGFLIYLHNDGKIEKRPILRNPDPETDAGTYLTDHQVMSLFANTEDSKLHVKVFTSAHTGMRKREIELITRDGSVDPTGLPTSYLSHEKRAIYLRAEDTKIRKARWIPLPDDVYEELCYIERTARGKYLFANDDAPDSAPPRNTDKRAWTTVRKKAGVKCRFHDLRHTYLTNAFKMAKAAMKGKDVKFSIDCFMICEAAGLSIEEAQNTYLHLDVDDLRNVTTLVSYGASESQKESEVFRANSGQIAQ